jgi:hypothetical protein
VYFPFLKSNQIEPLIIQWSGNPKEGGAPKQVIAITDTYKSADKKRPNFRFAQKSMNIKEKNDCVAEKRVVFFCKS